MSPTWRGVAAGAVPPSRSRRATSAAHLRWRLGHGRVGRQGSPRDRAQDRCEPLRGDATTDACRGLLSEWRVGSSFRRPAARRRRRVTGSLHTTSRPWPHPSIGRGPSPRFPARYHGARSSHAMGRAHDAEADEAGAGAAIRPWAASTASAQLPPTRGRGRWPWVYGLPRCGSVGAERHRHARASDRAPAPDPSPELGERLVALRLWGAYSRRGHWSRGLSGRRRAREPAVAVSRH
jgi:hypothetical protein